MEGTIFSLIPPVLALLLVVVTRRVLLSLGVGIVAGELLLNDFSLKGTAVKVYQSFAESFWAEGELNMWSIYIILFLFLLGAMTAFISISGGSRAFGEWAMRRVKTRTGAQIVAAFLGMLIFIDDYFNALAVGQISRPLTDRHQVSRAKLAYIIDSTSAPVCVVSPVSSWGAYIITMIATILTAHKVTDVTAFSAFIQMIPMNLYVIAALILVFSVAIFDLNIGSMKTHENRAMNEGHMIDLAKGEVPGELKQDLPVSKQGTVGSLVWPIVTLIAATVAMMLYTGYATVSAAGGTFTIFTIFENTDVTKSLFYGGIIGLLASLIFYAKTSDFHPRVVFIGMKEGVRSMLPAVYILVFAWAIVSIIGELKTGEYLAGLVEKSNIDIAYLPLLLFMVAGIMAFATGTSWGTFGIMMPIAGDIAAASDITMLLPALAAVLAGAVFGDHCSPISDTTILSSTGAGSHHIDHVMTQLPYALTSATISAVGYVVLGFTGSVLLGVMTVLIMMPITVIVFRQTTLKTLTEANDPA